MPPEAPTSLTDQLADIKETLEREKIKLTPEAEEYIATHLRIVQDKIADKQDITEGDLAFIGKVKTWIFLAEEWRDRYKSIEEMDSSDKMKSAQERGLKLQQWLDLSHMAESKGEDQNWIDETFTFSGGKIICEGNLRIYDNEHITKLPENLHINRHLYCYNSPNLIELPNNLHVKGCALFDGCTSLTTLSRNNLSVGETLLLDGCTELIKNKQNVLPNLWKQVNSGAIASISLKGWSIEDGDIPDNLHVSHTCNLADCELITSLPNKLFVDNILGLNGCTGLMNNKETVLPDIWSRINKGEIKGIGLGGWPIENGDIPDNLHIKTLGIIACHSLTKLPDGLVVGDTLSISSDANEQVKQDAERLHREGKIRYIHISEM